MTDVKMKLHLCKEPDKFQFVELSTSKNCEELYREKRSISCLGSRMNFFQWQDIS